MLFINFTVLQVNSFIGYLDKTKDKAIYYQLHLIKLLVMTT
ncbi:hypothetical protein AB434_1736 [Heyndrickxia coagulans]|uniref:Uncharacterized protein n=1 Tax=Heyndrickxia coagulans TaxID=1398 RepID=A0AAN0TAR7_HEYCO|nr:hypothetical protein SB48_HM08orf05736 [Heyndrickxia coagulans]AKN54141.1 hypothetical protein AB434_1736 [Heyndrickxia coagulans]